MAESDSRFATFHFNNPIKRIVRQLPQKPLHIRLIWPSKWLLHE